MHNDGDVSTQGHCVSGTIHLGDQGSQKIGTGTHRFGTSRHPFTFVQGANMRGGGGEAKYEAKDGSNYLIMDFLIEPLFFFLIELSIYRLSNQLT